MSTPKPEWVIGFDEPDQTWYIAIMKDGSPVRLNGHYLTHESAKLDAAYLQREYERVTKLNQKEGCLFN